MSISRLVPLREAESALLEEMRDEGRSVRTGELVERSIKHFSVKLTPSELQRRTPSGTFWWPGRFRYDLDRLKKKGEAIRPAKGYWKITELGCRRLTGPKLFDSKKEFLDLAEEVIQAIKAGEVTAIIQLNGAGFTVELGRHIKETQIVLRKP